MALKQDFQVLGDCNKYPAYTHFRAIQVTHLHDEMG